MLYLCGVHKPFTLPWEETVPARDEVLLSRSLGPAAMLNVSLIKSGPLGPLLVAKNGPQHEKWPSQGHFWLPKIDLGASFSCQKWIQNDHAWCQPDTAS